MRITKPPAERKAEILSIAAQIFQQKGYSATSVDEIVRTLGIAKGTFYYYFKSKEELLFELARQVVEEMQTASKAIIQTKELNAIEKFCALLDAQNQVVDTENHIVESMHLPENRALHDQINIETVRVLGESFANIIEQGNQEGVFHVNSPLATAQFILAGSLFLFGDGIFNWTSEEKAERQIAMLELIERTLGVMPNTLIQKLGESLCKD